jgi:hypothetical protein
MLTATAVTDAAITLALALLVLWMWRSLRRSKQLIRQLQKRIRALERERSTLPAPRVSFEFNGSTREALLHVTNDGGEAEMWAPLSVEGALARRLSRNVCAAWTHGGARAVLRRGESATLRLAQLDLSVFPYARWQIYGIAPGEMISVRALHTSTIGGDPGTHAPTMFLQVALATAPESVGPPPQCTIALQPFEAIRLRPL